MFIRTEKETLLSAITPALCAVSTKSTAPVLECLYFQADEATGRVTVTGFDNNKGLKTDFPATVLAGGGILLFGHKLSSFVRALPDGEVTLSNDDKLVATVSCKKSKMEFSGLSEQNFPALPELSGDKEFLLEQGVLKKLLSGVIFSYLQEETKPALTGVLFELAGGKLSLCSCDGYRISKTAAAIESDLETSFLVPGRNLSELIKLLDDSDEPVKISVARRHVIFTFNDLIFFSRLVEEPFIDYKRTLPNAFSCTASFDPQEALQCVERTALVIDDRAKSPAIFTVGGEVIYLKSQTSNGKVESEFSAQIEGEGLVIGFNTRYLADALKGALAFGSGTVFFEFVSPLKGAVLRPMEGDDFYYMILPIRIQQ